MSDNRRASAEAATSIVELTRKYEDWLKRQLGSELVKDDLDQKHELMCEKPRFLRATYWRWAETILDICPQLAETPAVLAVGDIHIENFGTWRDGEGRLIWGVNDFDEAAEMPYAIDLVRLAASAVLADREPVKSARLCKPILAGYKCGLADPRALVLEWQRSDLLGKLRAKEKTIRKFRDDYDARNWKKNGERPSPSFRRALKASRPDAAVELTFRRRTAGGGSLGRPRWVGVGDWQGAPIVREAKAMVASAWTLPDGRAPTFLRCHEIAHGRFRSPDPWLQMIDLILVRRLSPNNRKLDFGESDGAGALVEDLMLEMMGKDLAAVHLGVGDCQAKVRQDFESRSPHWWAKAVDAAVIFVGTDYEAWCRHQGKLNSKAYSHEQPGNKTAAVAANQRQHIARGQ